MQRILITLYLFPLFISFTLTAEVEEIVLNWNALRCLEICIPGIERNLRSIREVTHLQINSRSGTAVMGWDPNYPFTFPPFRWAMAGAGITITDMHLRVRGTITHDMDNYYLVSSGDLSRFLLIGPLLFHPARFTPRNIESHPLPPQIKQQLMEIEEKRQTVVIEGPLFFPFEKFPRTLIVEQIRVENESEMDRRYVR
jgi:hypothetical protein